VNAAQRRLPPCRGGLHRGEARLRGLAALRGGRAGGLGRDSPRLAPPGAAGAKGDTHLVEGAVQIGCMHIGAGGVVGYHQATVRQLFLVVAGTGWVRGADETRRPIAAGQAAYRAPGRWHESGSQDGMTAIVIEAATLDAERDMPAI
jgi:hypothetical protein